jgi:hypothetical protein
MILKPCPRAEELRHHLALCQWPQAAPAELRAHAAACRSCADLALLTETFQRARTASAASAPLTAPGTLWWRAQFRRRQAMAERIARPILGAQILAIAVNVALLVGLLVYQARHGQGWLFGPTQLPQADAFHFNQLWTSGLFNFGWSPIVTIPALATLVLLSGVAVYLATEKQ